ncbi:MAG: hypothetical protein IPL87_02945 [Candidatus Moraniibacteriota bacterium]|nr:MAG: hypothetical protein IPL87_02945 [Candidatus Moranbacteria bacterium]
MRAKDQIVPGGESCGKTTRTSRRTQPNFSSIESEDLSRRFFANRETLDPNVRSWILNTVHVVD